jgi:hypothetical protein
MTSYLDKQIGLGVPASMLQIFRLFQPPHRRQAAWVALERRWAVGLVSVSFALQIAWRFTAFRLATPNDGPQRMWLSARLYWERFYLLRCQLIGSMAHRKRDQHEVRIYS